MYQVLVERSAEKDLKRLAPDNSISRYDCAYSSREGPVNTEEAPEVPAELELLAGEALQSGIEQKPQEFAQVGADILLEGVKADSLNLDQTDNRY